MPTPTPQEQAADALDRIGHSRHADTMFDLLHELFNAPGYMLQRMTDQHERPALAELVELGLVAVCPDRGQHHLTSAAADEYGAVQDDLAGYW